VPVASARGDKRTLEVLLTARDQTKATLRRMQSQVRSTSRIVTSSFTRAAGAAKALQGQIFNLRNALVLGVGAAMNEFTADFEDGLAQIAGLLDDPDQWMKGFDRGIRDIAIETGDSFDSLTKSLFDTISAGVDAASALDVLRAAARLASAGGTDTATAVDGLTSLLNAYGLEASEATRITNALFAAQKKGKTTIAELAGSVGQVAPLASKLGVTIDEVTGALAALTTAGLSTDEAATQLKGFFTGIVKPGIGAADAARELGIQFDSSVLKGGNFLDFIRELDKATGGSTEKLARLFPNVRALQGVLGLARGDARAFSETLEAMGDAAGSVNKAFAITNNTLGAQIRRTWRSVQSSIIDVIEGLRPQIEKFLGGIRSGFERLAKSRDQVVALFGAIGQTIEEFFRLIKTAWKNNDVWQLVLNGAKAMVLGLSDLLVQAAPALVNTVAAIGRSIGQALFRSFVGATRKEIVETANSGFFGNQLAELVLGKDELEKAKAQFAEVERLKQVYERRGLEAYFSSGRGLSSMLRGEADLDKGYIGQQIREFEAAIAKLEPRAAKLRSNLERVGGERTGGLLGQISPIGRVSRSIAKDLKETEKEIQQYRAQIQTLKDLSLPQEVIAERLKEAKGAFNGSQIFAKDEQEKLKTDLTGFWADLSRTLQSGVSRASAEQGDAFVASLKGSLDRLRDAWTKLSSDAGSESGQTFASSLKDGIRSRFKSVTDAAVDGAKSLVDKVRGALSAVGELPLIKPLVDGARHGADLFHTGRSLRGEASGVAKQIAELNDLRSRIQAYGGESFAPIQLTEQVSGLESALQRSVGQLQLNIEAFREMGGTVPPELQKVVDGYRDIIGIQKEMEERDGAAGFLKGCSQ
jgi:TP901 family phage tail tape measure protein